MTGKFERKYNDWLATSRPWQHSSRPAWSYYYRPWLHYPYDRSDSYSKSGYPYCTPYSPYSLPYPSQDSSAIEDYLQTLEKLDNLRSNIHNLRDDLELSSKSINESLNRSRKSLKDDLELSRSYRRAQLEEELDLSRSYRLAALSLDDTYDPPLQDTRHDPLLDPLLDRTVWSEAAPRPRLISSATPYRGQINTLRYQSLRLEEDRLLEIRRLQELEMRRGPRPKWYELRTSQFHKEARKNNVMLAAKRQWDGMRDYTEQVWRNRDLARSNTTI